MLIPRSERSERSGISTATRELRRGQVAKRTVRTMVVEVLSPGSRFEPCVGFAEQFCLVQVLVTELAVETLAEAVLPWRAGFDVEHTRHPTCQATS